jgi:hypothetical protein
MNDGDEEIFTFNWNGTVIFKKKMDNIRDKKSAN